MPYEPPPHLAALSLSEIAEQVAARKLPPIAGWKPERTGDSRMAIQADGTWLHDGSPINRQGMVRLFSGLLVRDEDGSHHLVTPFEKLAIAVEDAPFIAVDVADKDGGLAFRLNTDELVVAGPDNPLRAAGEPDLPAIYLTVRDGLEARLNRSTWLQLADIALADGDDLVVKSNGATFDLAAR